MEPRHPRHRHNQLTLLLHQPRTLCLSLRMARPARPQPPRHHHSHAHRGKLHRSERTPHHHPPTNAHHRHPQSTWQHQPPPATHLSPLLASHPRARTSVGQPARARHLSAAAETQHTRPIRPPRPAELLHRPRANPLQPATNPPPQRPNLHHCLPRPAATKPHHKPHHSSRSNQNRLATPLSTRGTRY